MPAIRETRRVPWSARQMFDLVADVASYGQFLPWVVATRVRANDGREMLAEMLVGFSALREKFTSRVELRAPDEIRVHYVDGPLRNLDNRWHFSDLPQGGCEIDFSVEFSFKNALFEKLAGQYCEKAFRKMVSAFEERAEALYGSSHSSATSAA